MLPLKVLLEPLHMRRQPLMDTRPPARRGGPVTDRKQLQASTPRRRLGLRMPGQRRHDRRCCPCNGRRRSRT
eukprot:10781351-Alexandrium_andersonii.AAC.1